MAGALIVTAELAAEDFAWLDRLRQAHFPPERNRLRAHLTMFHALPPSAEAEVRRALSLEASDPPPHATMDFAAWFEAYLDGGWYTFDPRNHVPRIGRILMARGRDAADVAISNSFGPITLTGFKVITDEVAQADLQATAVS